MTDLHEKESKEDPFSFANDPVADAADQDDEEDDFGDFTSGNSGVPVEAKKIADTIQDSDVKQGETTIEDDLFGGFESSAPPSSHVERLVASELPLTSNEAENDIGDPGAVPDTGSYDDFGSFEAAESPASPKGEIEDDSVTADDKQGGLESERKADDIITTGLESEENSSMEGTNGQRIPKLEALLPQDNGDVYALTTDATDSSEKAVEPVSPQSEENIMGEPRVDSQEGTVSRTAEQDVGIPSANFSSFGNSPQSDLSSAANAPLPETKDEEVDLIAALATADLEAESAEQEDGRGLGDISGPSDAAESNNVDPEDFGGFANRADSKENGGESAAYEQESTKDVHVDDDFGEFGSAKLAEVCSTDDDFGDFKDTQPATSPGEDPEQDFDDFGSADQEAINDMKAGEIGTSQQIINANDEDDFGDFGSAQVEHKTATEESENDNKEGQRHHSRLADEDFGEFDTATPSEKPDEGEVINDAKAGEIGTPRQVIGASDEDDFGDFGSAQDEHKTANDGDENDVKEGQRHHSELAEEDFGDFGTATPSEKPDEDAVDHALGPNDNDDEFGNVGGANENNATDRVDEQVSDDDFGDFDGAAISAESNEHASADRQIIQDDTDDDFGDFGSAEPISEVEMSAAKGDTSGDEFGDFSSFNEAEPDHAAPSGPISSPQTPGLDGNDKALLNRAKNAFQRLFAPHSSCVEADSEDDIDTSETKVSVEELLNSVADQRQENTTNSRADAAIDVLHDTSMLRPTSSRVIIAGDGRGPFAHFAFPIGGFGSYGTTSSKQSEASSRKSCPSYLPDVLPIKLPSSEDKAPDMASPQPPPRETVPAATVVSLPLVPAMETKKSADEAAAADRSEAALSEESHVQQFLKQIPDLSFMLSPKLSLPNDKK